MKKEGAFVIKKVLGKSGEKNCWKEGIYPLVLYRELALHARSFLTDAALKARFRRVEPMAIHRRGWVEVNREPLA